MAPRASPRDSLSSSVCSRSAFCYFPLHHTEVLQYIVRSQNVIQWTVLIALSRAFLGETFFFLTVNGGGEYNSEQDLVPLPRSLCGCAWHWESSVDLHEAIHQKPFHDIHPRLPCAHTWALPVQLHHLTLPSFRMLALPPNVQEAAREGGQRLSWL